MSHTCGRGGGERDTILEKKKNKNLRYTRVRSREHIGGGPCLRKKTREKEVKHLERSTSFGIREERGGLTRRFGAGPINQLMENPGKGGAKKMAIFFTSIRRV